MPSGVTMAHFDSVEIPPAGPGDSGILRFDGLRLCLEVGLPSDEAMALTGGIYYGWNDYHAYLDGYFTALKELQITSVFSRR